MWAVIHNVGCGRVGISLDFFFCMTFELLWLYTILYPGVWWRSVKIVLSKFLPIWRLHLFVYSHKVDDGSCQLSCCISGLLMFQVLPLLFESLQHPVELKMVCQGRVVHHLLSPLEVLDMEKNSRQRSWLSSIVKVAA